MSSSYRNSLNEWLSNLEVVGSNVLDIGGSQERVKDRVKSWKVDNYAIADLPQPHKDSPKPDVELDLNTSKPMAFEEYDIIFCLEVFDYVYDPVNAMKLISSALLPGGKAWITFVSHYPLHQPVEDDALRYMPGAIYKLADRFKLQVVQMIPRRMETNLLDQWVRAERLRAAKHEDHNFMGFIVELEK